MGSRRSGQTGLIAGHVLFNDLRHPVQAILHRRCMGLECVALIGFGHHVGAQTLVHVQRVRHGQHVLRLSAGQLSDQVENIGHLLRVGLHAIGGKVEPRKVRNLLNLVWRKGHGKIGLRRRESAYFGL